MRLWTIQSEAVFQKLKSTGEYVPSWELSLNESSEWLRPAYEWVVPEFGRRVGHPVTTPLVWFFDFQVGSARRLPKNWKRPCVRMVFELPESDFLRLDEDAWLCIINRDWAWPSELLNADDFNQQLDQWEAVQLAQGRTKEDTWSSAFDHAPYQGSRYHYVSERLHLGQLVSYATFR